MGLDDAGKAKDRGKDTPGQNLQEGSDQPSAVEQITSAFEEGKQYPGADVKKAIEDALSADGRAQKDRADKAEANLRELTEKHENLTTQFNTVSGQVQQLLQEKDDAEVEAVKDDQVALASLKARQANRAERIKLEAYDNSIKARETKLGERETTLNQKEASINIKLAAMAAGVDEKQLADLVPDGNPERLSRAATILKQSAGGQPPPGGEKPPGLRQPPASAISAGGDSKSLADKLLDKAKNK